MPETATERSASRGSIPRLSASELAHEDDRRRAVVDARRVPGRDAATLAEDGPQAGEALCRGAGARMLVAHERLVGPGRVDGDDLRVEVAGVDRGHGTLLAQRRERVLLPRG